MQLGEAPEIDGVDDAEEFMATREAFQLLGFSEQEQQNIFVILASILHLGNVSFESGGGARNDSESCTIPSDDEAIQTMAELLQVYNTISGIIFGALSDHSRPSYA